MKFAPLFAAIAIVAVASAVSADQCAYCNKPIQGAPYVLQSAKHKAVFKCAYCAIAEATGEDDWKGNVTMIAPSENAKKPVTVKRVGNTWKMFPTTAVFTEASPIRHSICGEQYRAFTTKAAADAYIKAGKADKVISLQQLIQKAS